MRAIGYSKNGPLDAPDSLVLVDVPKPKATGRDILVSVKAVSVNPHDVKMRANLAPPAGQTTILGRDASGIVVETGDKVSLFKVGDEVMYAGSNMRPGNNSEFHLVDERIAGKKPRSLSHAETAAMPLTTLTAWEAVFDRLNIARKVPGAANALLMIGGGGGVPSMAIQLMRQLTDLQIIATASRPETETWVRSLGAHHVIDHSKPLTPQVEALKIGQPAFVFCAVLVKPLVADIAQLIAPQGRLALINNEQVDLSPFMRKCVSIHWEAMFTRSIFETEDMAEQHNLLNKVADLVDAGKIRTTMTRNFGPMSLETMKAAHAAVETGRTLGKVVVEGF